MPDIPDGETAEVKGSAAKPYVLKNTGGVYSCSCPAWRNQSIAIEKRTCKHLRKYRGEQAELDRVGNAAPSQAAKADEAADEAKGPPLLLAQSWTNDVDLAGWWMSEKLDGVRAFWDGKQLLSRLGNVLHAPDWFVERLPMVPLDGELWLARKSFQRTVSIVRRQDKSDHWKEISYLIFDAPTQQADFEERMQFLRDSLAGNNKAQHLRLLEHTRCRGADHLREELTRVESLGGEGLMLREPGSRYQIGRSATLLKVKTFHDAEARVVDHQAGSGRHKGRLGALVVQLADGTQFSVGTGFTDAQRENPPAIGSAITFRYQELSDGGVPRFPSFVRASPSAAILQPHPATAAPPSAISAKTVTTAQSPAARTSKRYFEYTDDKSAKFWEIAIAGNEVTVRFGRVGTTGQSQMKTFGDNAAAQRHADKLIREKIDKGYIET